MSEINFSINSDEIFEGIKDKVVNLVTDEVDMDTLTQEVIDNFPFDKVGNMILQDIDITDLTNDVVAEIDYSDLADSIQSYLDWDGNVGSVIDDRLSDLDYLSSESLLDLMHQYDPGNGCSLGRAATEIIDNGVTYMIDRYLADTSIPSKNMAVDSLVNLILYVIEKKKETVVEDAPPVMNVSETSVTSPAPVNIVQAIESAEPRVSFSANDLSSIVFYMLEVIKAYNPEDIQNNWETIFPVVLNYGVKKYDPAMLDTIGDIFPF